jgi:hypothetical protein
MSDIKFPSWIDEAEELYKRGMPYQCIAPLVNADRKTVSYYLRKKGYKSNEKCTRQVDPKKLRKYKNDNENVFQKIDNEEKAYWLGFLYADGYVSDARAVVELCLKEEDYNHIVKFKKFLKIENEIKIKKRTIGSKIFYGYKLSINSSIMKNDLINLGCTPRKSDELSFPTEQQVPINLVSHFVRGYFDGDGCITSGNTSKVIVELLGTPDFLYQYMNWSCLHHNKINKFNHTDKIKRVAYAGIYAKIILDKMYKDSTIYLDRKYNKYIATLAL